MLRTWPNYFDAVQRGDKNFEVRRDDRGFQRGDIVVLQKFDPEKRQYVLDGYGFKAKPQEVRKRIAYVLTGGQFGVEPGYVVMGLVDA
jgi:hypothetical protein